MAIDAPEPTTPRSGSGPPSDKSQIRTTALQDFPCRETLHSWVSTSYDREFIDLEFSSGLSYYLRRLDVVAFAGQHVLDAGCGMGQWTVALGTRFERVTGIDVNKTRLEFARRLLDESGQSSAMLAQASLEHLPFPDETFDHIFCYGVIMFTAIAKTLVEFRRVLKPGGRIYCCLNGDGWSHYLIEERGVSNPATREAGLGTLYNTYWRRALQVGLRCDLRSGVSRFTELSVGPDVVERVRRWWRTGRWESDPEFRIENLTEPEKFKLVQVLLSSSASGRILMNSVHEYLGPTYELRLQEDAWTVSTSDSGPHRTVGAEAFLPEEVAPAVAEAGLTDFDWGPEGHLLVNWRLGSPQSKYQAVYRGVPAVWEFTCVRPAWPEGPVDLSVHYGLASMAMQQQAYLGSSTSPLLSNNSRGSYPQTLMREAEARAARLGGGRYLGRLVERVTEGASSDEALIRSLIKFVQRALFRDPVSQPLKNDGDLPDPLAILMCGRGRCGHASVVLSELFRIAGLSARVHQLDRHVVCEVLCDDRWVIADADAFKHGVIPLNRNGRLLSLADLQEDPYQMDRFPATGWSLPPRSQFTRDLLGREVAGYIDALEPSERGYVSGYYITRAQGFPPSVPRILSAVRRGLDVVLSWSAAKCPGDALRFYRIIITDTPRKSDYQNSLKEPGSLQVPFGTVLQVNTTSTELEFSLPSACGSAFASVTAVGSRVDLEPATFFWPSEEIQIDA